MNFRQLRSVREAVRRGAWLRGYACSFIELFVPTLTQAVVTGALQASTAPRSLRLSIGSYANGK